MVYAVEKCCFTVALRIGSLITGYIGLVGSFIMLVMSIVDVANSDHVAANAGNEQKQLMDTIILIVFCIVLVTFLLFFIFNIILLIGLHKHKRGCVQAYLIFTSIYFVLCVLGFISGITTKQPITSILISLCSMVITGYFLLVVRSYYLKMNDQPKSTAVYNTAK